MTDDDDINVTLFFSHFAVDERNSKLGVLENEENIRQNVWTRSEERRGKFKQAVAEWSVRPALYRQECRCLVGFKEENFQWRWLSDE